MDLFWQEQQERSVEHWALVDPLVDFADLRKGCRKIDRHFVLTVIG